MKFGERVKAIRTRRGLTLEWLSREAGISKTYLWEIESREPAVSAVVLDALANTLGYSMDDLFHGTGRAEEAKDQQECKQP